MDLDMLDRKLSNNILIQVVAATVTQLEQAAHA